MASGLNGVVVSGFDPDLKLNQSTGSACRRTGWPLGNRRRLGIYLASCSRHHHCFSFQVSRHLARFGLLAGRFQDIDRPSLLFGITFPPPFTVHFPVVGERLCTMPGMRLAQ